MQLLRVKLSKLVRNLGCLLVAEFLATFPCLLRAFRRAVRLVGGQQLLRSRGNWTRWKNSHLDRYNALTHAAETDPDTSAVQIRALR